MEQEIKSTSTALDSLIQDKQIQMLKTALPYINNSTQRTMAFFIKFLELERTFSLYSSPQTSIQMCSISEDDEPAPIQMLYALREYCTEKEQEYLDMMMNFMQMFSAYETLFT